MASSTGTHRSTPSRAETEKSHLLMSWLTNPLSRLRSRRTGLPTIVSRISPPHYFPSERLGENRLEPEWGGMTKCWLRQRILQLQGVIWTRTIVLVALGDNELTSSIARLILKILMEAVAIRFGHLITLKRLNKCASIHLFDFIWCRGDPSPAIDFR